MPFARVPHKPRLQLLLGRHLDQTAQVRCAHRSSQVSRGYRYWCRPGAGAASEKCQACTGTKRALGPP